MVDVSLDGDTIRIEQFFCGDALKLLPMFPPKSVDFTITSPPFKTYHKDVQEDEDYYNWLDCVLYEIERVTKKYAFVFNSSTRLIEICKRFDPVRVLIWYKGFMKYSYRYEPIFVFQYDENLKINKRIWSDIFKFQAVHKWITPYQNPLKLYEALIGMVTEPDDVVLDPFSGSGTTARACRNLGRKWICIEVVPEHVKTAKDLMNKAALKLEMFLND